MSRPPSARMTLPPCSDHAGSAPGEPRHRHGRGAWSRRRCRSSSRPRKALTARSTATWPAPTRSGSCRRGAMPWPCSLGPDAYVTPSWYRVEAGAREGGADLELRRRPRLWPGRVLRGRGPPARRGHAADRTCTSGSRAEPWAVTDAPEAFIRAQLRGIVGLRHADHADRGQAQDEPEPERRGPGRASPPGSRPATVPTDREVAALIPT